MTEKRCIACGMPMTKNEEFAKGDPSKDYCCYCARPDGTMRSYDEVLVGITGFIVRSQGLDESAARNTAKQMMTTLPAWKGR
jgi:hypothetical protein